MCFGCSKELSYRNTSFECLKHNFTIEGKQQKPRFGCIKGPSHRDGSLNTQIVCFFAEINEKHKLKSTQRRATNGLPAICHLNGLSPVGR